MTAFGQGGVAPPAAPGAPAPAPGTPAPAPAAQQQDRFGFAAHVAGAPEHLRPMLQTAFDQIGPQLNQQFDRFAPLEPHIDTLMPLLQPDPSGSTPLEGLSSLYELFNEQSQTDEPVEALLDWWEQVGETFGYFDDEDGGAPGTAPGAAAPAADGIDLNAIEDPGMRAVVQALTQQNEALQAKLGEFENTLTSQSQQQQLNTRAEQIGNDIKSRMKNAGIEGHDNLKSDNAVKIMRIAAGYGEDPQAIEKAVADYLQISGRAPAAPVDPALDGAAALQAALGGGGGPTPTPGPALGRGNADAEPEPVSGWDGARKLALQRLTAQ